MTKQIFIILMILSGIALRPAAEAATNVNLAPVAEPSTSHVSRDASLAALHDGHAPKVSRDRGKGAYGNWPSKGTGNGGPTLYRHNEGAVIGFYDGHAERLAKEKVWIAKNFTSNPKQPGMWVAVPKVWNKYR